MSLSFSLVICTYKRPVPVITLLESVAKQTLYPTEILVIDGSPDDDTARAIGQRNFDRLRYFKVSPEHRGLTRQRNFGISQTSDVDVIAFLDDDTVLEPEYFSTLISTYSDYPDAQAVGGYIVNEADWRPVSPDHKPSPGEFVIDGFMRLDPSRFVLRKKLGLDSDVRPGFMPAFSHGRSVGFLPPSGKVYRVEQLMGCVFTFRKSVFEKFSFSHYFEGYGLYEDADICLRIAQSGSLYVHTGARLYHYHDDGGRPNKYNYGRMVVRNGWYVWRVRHPRPSFKNKLKWQAITWLLIAVRLSNAITSRSRKEAFTEAAGRISGWFSLLSPPRQV
jgi:glycosyltransferase involved in cell wall biosynthesis